MGVPSPESPPSPDGKVISVLQPPPPGHAKCVSCPKVEPLGKLFSCGQCLSCYLKDARHLRPSRPFRKNAMLPKRRLAANRPTHLAQRMARITAQMQKKC